MAQEIRPWGMTGLQHDTPEDTLQITSKPIDGGVTIALTALETVRLLEMLKRYEPQIRAAADKLAVGTRA